MAVEDFTTYTEVDVGANHITFSGTNRIDHLAERDEETYLYDDKGAGHFGNFEHLVDMRSDYLENYCVASVWLISNAVDDMKGLETGNDKYISVYASTSSTKPRRIYLKNFDGTTATNDVYAGAANTWYFLTIERNGATGTVKIYSNSARTNLLDTLTITVENDTFRYIYACSAYNTGDAGRACNNDVENLDLQEAGETHTPGDTAKSSDALTFKAEVPIGDTAKASDSVSFFKGLRFSIGDTAKASDDLTFKAEISIEDTAKASDLFSSDAPAPPPDVSVDSSCATFSLLSASYSVYFTKPIWGGEQYSLQKDLQSFNFWSGNFNIHDKGISNEPIILSGVEIGSQTIEYNHDMFIAKFVNIRAMARNNEEVEIAGLGNCIDAVYVIKSFSTKTMHKPDARIWTLTLEYVRDA